MRRTFVDLGMSPLSNAYLSADDAEGMEPFYPLRVYLCEECLLVQLPAFETPENIFGEYAYFSSYSESWLRHCERFAVTAIDRLGLDAESTVVEVASNDGYLLRHFAARGIPVLGIEPARNVAEVARRNGISTRSEFFGAQSAARLVREGIQADLLIGNNVFAHVPDINDFSAGLKRVLAPGGMLTLEFPHLLRLMEGRQFDTIYHEHFSYLSLHTAGAILQRQGLRIVDVEELATHGGSLRVYVTHAEDETVAASPRVAEVAAREVAGGLTSVEGYAGFARSARALKRDLLDTLIAIKRRGDAIVGYGAPAKGNTLLNYCGIGTDFLDYTVDRSPHKQGRLLPGSHIPIHAPERICETRPAYVLILPWNLKEEIMAQLAWIRDWGGQFIVPIPTPAIY